MLKMTNYFHHFLPFLLIFMLVCVVVISFLVAYAGKDLDFKKYKLQSITMILAHIQLVLGIILFFDFVFTNPSWAEIMGNSSSRNAYIEHPFAMLLGVIFISAGNVKAKKIEDNIKSAKTIFVYFLIALILILAKTPFDKLLA